MKTKTKTRIKLMEEEQINKIQKTDVLIKTNFIHLNYFTA